MRFYIMTLVSIITVLAIKSYTINAQAESNIDDLDVEIMASAALLTKADTVRHQKMIKRFVKTIESSPYVYGEFSGSADFPNSVYENYQRIERVSTAQELNTMLLHESPVVRVYAHRALMANQMEIYGDNLDALVADSAEVYQIDGLAISKVRVMDIVTANMFRKPAEQ